MATEAQRQRRKNRAAFWIVLGVFTFGCLPLFAVFAVFLVWLMFILPRFVVAIAFVGFVSLAALSDWRNLKRVLKRSWGARLLFLGSGAALLIACVGYTVQADFEAEFTVRGSQGLPFKVFGVCLLLIFVGGLVGLAELGTLVVRMYRAGKEERI